MTSTRTTELRGGSWLVNPDRSNATFVARGLGGVKVTGAIPIRHAAVEVDAVGTPVGVFAELDIASIDTGSARRDRDLRKPRLLNLDRFPTMTFTSTMVESTELGWHVTGTLSARGAHAPVEFDVTVSLAGDSATVVANGVLDRRPLGIKAPGFVIRRRMRIRIEGVLDEPR